jgi:hypothetical protein
MPEPNEVIVKDPEILGVLPFFAVRACPCRIFSIILRAAKLSMNSLTTFPTVSREQAIAALEHAKSLLVSKLG